MTTDASKRILVTGGSAGIGLALCHQLVVEDGCHVYLGSRSLERGQAAVASIDAVRPAGCSGFVELVHLDVGDADSVSAAVDAVRASLGPNGSLYGLVNNAGTGLATGASPDEVVNTNLFGVKRMCDAFLEAGLVSSRIVNVGSGSGPGYVRRCPLQTQPALCKAPADWAAIESQLARSEDGMSGFGSSADVNGGYGISKALVALYTMLCARMHPETKRPEEGTVSIRHCLFQPLEGNGWYYGSDAVRSPLHFMRNPGEPAYDGVVDGVVGVA
jgi:NAD(P)-dependent dehydrogenase (short-subunit alcohol dehydrogenase family)